MLDRVGVRRATVVGHSTGGAVATSLAEQRRELVTAITLIDTARAGRRDGADAVCRGTSVRRAAPAGRRSVPATPAPHL
nr:alpha/beta hydrolase [Streptomyces sp. ID38640]